MVRLRSIVALLVTSAFLVVAPPVATVASANHTEGHTIDPGSGGITGGGNDTVEKDITGPSGGDGQTYLRCNEKGEGVYVLGGSNLVLYDKNFCDGVRATWAECLTGYDVWRFYGRNSEPVQYATMSQVSLRDWCLSGRQSNANFFFPNPWDEKEVQSAYDSATRGNSTGGVPADSFLVRQSPWKVTRIVGGGPAVRGTPSSRGEDVYGSFTNAKNSCFDESRGVLGPLDPNCIPTSGPVIKKWSKFGLREDCKVAMPDGLPPASRPATLAQVLRPSWLVERRSAVDADPSVVESEKNSRRDIQFVAKEALASAMKATHGKLLAASNRPASVPAARIADYAEKFTFAWFGWPVDMRWELRIPGVASLRDVLPEQLSDTIEAKVNGTWRQVQLGDSCASPLNFVRFGIPDPTSGKAPEYRAKDPENALLGMCVAQRLRPAFKTDKNTWTSFLAYPPSVTKGTTSWPLSKLDQVRDRYSNKQVNIREDSFLNVTVGTKVEKVTRRGRNSGLFEDYRAAVSRMLAQLTDKGHYSGPGGYWFPKKSTLSTVSLTPFVSSPSNTKPEDTMTKEAALETLQTGMRCFKISPDALGATQSPPPPTPPPTPTPPPPTPGPTPPPMHGSSGDVTVYVSMDTAFSAQGGYSPRTARVSGVSGPVCREADRRLCPTLLWVRGGLRLGPQNFGMISASTSYRPCASPTSARCDYYVYDPVSRSTSLAPAASRVDGQQVSALFFSPTPSGVQMVAGFEGLNALIQTYYLEPTFSPGGTYECGTEEEPRTCAAPPVLNPPSMWIVRAGAQVPLNASQIAVVPASGTGTLTRRVYGSVG